jgi:hypothetical protein
LSSPKEAKVGNSNTETASELTELKSIIRQMELTDVQKELMSSRWLARVSDREILVEQRVGTIFFV